MKTIAYYISDYGFGHATRSVALIRELLSKSEEIKVIICHSFAMTFLKESLKDDRVTFREVHTDVGYYLKENSLMLDPDRLEDEYSIFVSDWGEKQERERCFLEENGVDLVVSDISPLPFQAAYELGIPAVGVSNFCWYTAYQGLVHNRELALFYQAYQCMSSFYTLAGSKEIEWSADQREFGFFARNVDHAEIKRILQEINPHRKKVIFVGLGMKVEANFLNELPLWNSPDCVFIVSSNVSVTKRDNIFHIPSNYLETQNYIAASDLVITKAGWGTVSEAVLSQTPLLIIERDLMTEDQNTIDYLRNHALCKTINWSDFSQFIVNVQDMEAYHHPINDKKARNESMELANNLMTLLNV